LGENASGDTDFFVEEVEVDLGEEGGEESIVRRGRGWERRSGSIKL